MTCALGNCNDIKWLLGVIKHYDVNSALIVSAGLSYSCSLGVKLGVSKFSESAPWS